MTNGVVTAISGAAITPRDDTVRFGAYERYRKWRTNGITTLRTKAPGHTLILLSLVWILTDVSWYCPALEPSATAAPSAANNDLGAPNGTLCPEFLSW
jgi:hypothetical protein